MYLPILPSKTMDQQLKDGVHKERRLIRMPRKFRTEIEHDLGDLVYARSMKDGKVIALTVTGAYHDDVENDDMHAYVTTEIYNLITKGGADADIQPVDGITLGCDPELILVNRDGTIIPASGFLKKYGQVGYDGLLLELRPLPSTDEHTVAHNIFGLLGQMRAAIPNKEIRAIAVSSYHGNARITPKYSQFVKVTAGFHLHFGLPGELLGYQKRFIADQIVKTLDYYVGMPSIIPEGSTDSYRRSVPFVEYGKPGTYRIDDRTLEYRVPGGILLRHPVWTAGLIGLGAMVVEDMVARIKDFTPDFTKLAEIGNDALVRKLYPNIPPVMEIFSAICSPTADTAQRYLNDIWRDLENMISFPKRAESVVNFFRCLDNKYSLDIEENWWRYYGTGQPQQMDVLSSSFKASN